MASTGRVKSTRAAADRKPDPQPGSVGDHQVQALQSIQDQLLEIAARLAFVAANAGAAAKLK
jgi:hypothetical protein